MSGALEKNPKKMTCESTDSALMFTFYCDICDRPHTVFVYRDKTAQPDAENYDAFLEQARADIKMQVNRCSLCGKVVCDDCFRTPKEGDMCKECAESRGFIDFA